MKQIFTALLLCLLLGRSQVSLAQFTQSAQYVGIPSSSMDYFASEQRNSYWCWAASIQMVLNFNGVDITQEQIVARSYGRDPYGQLPNWAGSFDIITRNLNNRSVDNSGREYIVTSAFGMGVPSVQVLLSELAKGRPIIIAYRGSITGGHAVVITGASYVSTPNGSQVLSIIVRDPDPSPQVQASNGRLEYQAGWLASRMQAYWLVRVQ